MTTEQAQQVISLLEDIKLLLNNPDIEVDSVMSLLKSLEWLEVISSWLVIHIGVIVPAVIIIGFMYWSIRQFMDRYY